MGSEAERHGWAIATNGVTMRRIFLWMAGNRWLRDRVSRLWFVRRAVRRFLPGENATSALNAGAGFGAAGIGQIYTRIGEHVSLASEAAAVADHYLGVLEAIHERGLDGEISVKLSQLGLDVEPGRAFGHVERLADRAAQLGTFVWIDMEDSSTTDATLGVYRRLRAGHQNVGVCLQAYLHRSADDLQQLLPLVPAVRLVKGAYAEPATIAFQDKTLVDANFAALAVEMLAAVRSGQQARIALGTHDVRLVEQVDGHARALGLARRAFEVQMLYGVRLDQQHRLAREGYRVLDLISYGEAWYAWYMRRLAERPANVLFAIRQIVG
jgi:proline dehydrogenase